MVVQNVLNCLLNISRHCTLHELSMTPQANISDMDAMHSDYFRELADTQLLRCVKFIGKWCECMHV